MQNISINALGAILMVLIITTYSCAHQPVVEFVITNDSGQPVESLNITAHQLQPPQSVDVPEAANLEYRLDMTNVPHVDGDYLLRFHRGGVPDSLRFGYYSNGMPLEERIFIDIQRDTVLVKF